MMFLHVSDRYVMIFSRVVYSELWFLIISDPRLLPSCGAHRGLNAYLRKTCIVDSVKRECVDFKTLFKELHYSQNTSKHFLQYCPIHKTDSKHFLHY